MERAISLSGFCCNLGAGRAFRAEIFRVSGCDLIKFAEKARWRTKLRFLRDVMKKCCNLEMSALNNATLDLQALRLPADDSGEHHVHKKSPSLVDKHVGSRVRLRRTVVGMSQEKLADALDLTFQQVQKYEKGTNRIGASRLLSIATILGVGIEFFFEGLPESRPSATGEPSMSEFLCIPDSDRLVRSFVNLKDDEARRKVADLVEWMAKAGQVEAPRKAL
jgi:transcriptional regulator with XRE-family HTH domain